MQQIPAEHIEDIEILLRVDSAGACHQLLGWCREAKIGYSVGFDLTEPVRAAIAEIPDEDWVCSLDQDGTDRPTAGSPRSPRTLTSMAGRTGRGSWCAASARTPARS